MEFADAQTGREDQIVRRFRANDAVDPDAAVPHNAHFDLGKVALIGELISVREQEQSVFAIDRFEKSARKGLSRPGLERAKDERQRDEERKARRISPYREGLVKEGEEDPEERGGDRIDAKEIRDAR